MCVKDAVEHLKQRNANLASSCQERALHAAAGGGHDSCVMLLLELGTNPLARSSSGQTPADVAQAAGHLGLVAVLRDSESKAPEPAGAGAPAPELAPAAAAPAAPTAAESLESLTATKAPPAAAEAEAPKEEPAAAASFVEDPPSPTSPQPEPPSPSPDGPVPVSEPASPDGPPEDTPQSPDAQQGSPAPDVQKAAAPTPTPKAAKKPAAKQKAAGAGANAARMRKSNSDGKMTQTADKFRSESVDAPATRRHPLYNQGIVSGTRSMPYMTSFSGYKSSPKWSFRNRDSLPQKQRKFDQPGPGAYTVTNVDKFKYGGGARFGFGTGPRFQADVTKLPGPGAYSPFDPALSHGARFGFGTSLRSAGKSTVHETPPPGTYDIRSDMGRGKSWTARGKPKPIVEAGLESPGPGAYTPNMKVYEHGARFSFGNAGREGLVKSSERECPGPGAYMVSKTLGHDSQKFSIVSRPLGWDAPSTETRRSPGPGSYNAHITSFGY